MTREAALKEARKRWGQKAIIRRDPGRSSPEMRAEAHAHFLAAKDRLESVKVEIDAWLAASDWYQAKLTEKRDALKDKDRASSEMSSYTFAVGSDIGIAFSVKGQGDTWEEAFAKADARD